MAINLAEIIIICLIADYLMKRIHVPGLVGMLLTGILLGPSVLSLLHEQTLSIAGDLRNIALIIILLRAGLQINRKTLNEIGWRALLLAVVPGIFEMVTITLFAPMVLPLTTLEAAMLATILAAVSPAVVVPLMVKFQHERRGTGKGIPTLILAASSVDDINAIVISGIVIGIYTGVSVHIVADIAFIPLSVIIGVSVGILSGLAIARMFDRFHPRATKMALTVIGVSIFLFHGQNLLKMVHIPFTPLIAVMALAFILIEKREKNAHQISAKLEKIWVFSEIILFALIGAAVDLRVAVTAGLSGALVIFIGLAGRSVGTMVSLAGSRYSPKERAFIMVSYLPKATVQAAIGATPLLAMKTAGMPTGAGEIILAIAVLSILITAAPGAWLIQRAGKAWLTVDE
ncbi:MAG: cation:proton antiporter [Sphaerochaetaceae bacterium]|nr:cation:proton antiporter [Sphaerochaetaceae bacterium]